MPGSPLVSVSYTHLQQVQDALRQIMPAHVDIIRMDADSTKGKDSHKELLEAVSYTHLDVYKRQPYGSFGPIVPWALFLQRERASAVDPCQAVVLANKRPVSYTHLDVYKRQSPAPTR